jgi:hypothetical protein
MTLINEKYELDNIPISESIREGAKMGNSIDQLHILLRAMGMLEFNLEEVKSETKEGFKSINDRLDKMEGSLNDKEKRLIYLETYASWPHTVLRHAVAIIVGIVMGWGLHSILATFLH